MPIDQKVLDEINSSLSSSPSITGPAAIPGVNPDRLGRSLKLARTNGGSPLVEAEDSQALDMAERQAAWERLVNSAPKTVRHFAQNPIAASLADNDWEPVGAVEKSLFALGETARIPYQAGTGITGSLYGILAAATETGNTLASSAQRTAADLFSRLFLPPARQGQGKPTLDSLAGPMSPESDVSRFFRSASAGVAKLGRDYGTASGNYGGDIGRMAAGGAASAYQNAMMLGFAGTIAPAVAGTRMAVAAPMAPMGLVTAGGEYTKARDAGLSVGQSLAYAGSQGGIEMATEALPFGILVDDIKASMPIAKIIGKQLLAENLEEQVATHAQDFNEWINLHPDKTIGEYLKERPNAALETAVQTTVATLLLAGPGSIAMRATYLDMQRADEAMAQKRADALIALNTAAAASKTLQRDRQTFEEIVAAQTKEGPVTDVYIDAQVLNQSGLADQVVADSPSAAEQYQAALETGGQVRIPVSEYAARIASQAYAQELVEDVRFDPLDMTLREAKNYQQSGAMQELEQAMARIIGDKAQSDTFAASRDAVKQRVLDNLNALGRFTPQKNELDATLIAARSATRAAQLGITPEQFFDQYVLNVVAEGAGGQVLNQFAGQGALTADLDALKVAQDRVAAGEDAETVRRETGWHTGTDGKWRFEIDDSQAKIRLGYKGQPIGKARNGITENNGWMRLGDVLEHDALFTAYPQLAELSVKLMPADAMGGARGSLNDGAIMLDDSMSGTEAKSVILHEIQHAIQKYEGFATGGSPESIAQEYSAARSRLHFLEKDPDYIAGQKEIDELWSAAFSETSIDEKEIVSREAEIVAKHPALAEARAAMDVLRKSDEYGYESYRRLAGEVEARNTQARASMSDAERRATSPQSTADVAERDQIVTFAKGLAEMVSDKPTDADLYVGHNITAEKLRYALDLGGLPAPSLGVSRTTTGGFDGFGDITLLAPKDILESSGARTFNADVYSPRQPRPVYKPNQKAFDDLVSRLREMPGGFTVADIDEVGRHGAEALARSDAVKLLYLTEIGQAPKLKQQKAPAEIKKAAKTGLKYSYQLREDPTVKALAKKHYESMLQKYADAGLPEADLARGRSRYFEDSGDVTIGALTEFSRKVERYISDGGIDTGELRADIAKKLRTKSQSDAFEKWVKEMAAPMLGDKKLEISPSRRIPYTLDNVTAQMIKDLRGGEGFNYGAGSIRAMFAAEMRSVREIQNRRGEIVSGEDMKKAKEESQKKLTEVLDALKPFYKYDANGWGYMDDATRAIAEGEKGWREAFRVTAESRKIITDYVSYLKNLPTEYFETKMQRAVGLSEFAVAVVPTGTPADVISALEANGLKIKTYNKNKEGSRAKAIAAAGAESGVLFQSEGANQNADVAEAQRQINEQLAIADRMIAERGGLFAPNGEKSKLNRHQWAQVRTANFKRWFGDWENDPDNASKVVDANGEPLVVYHGTGGSFDAFDRAKGGSESGNDAGKKGHFLSGSSAIASDYALRARGGANVMPAFVALTNPARRKFRDIDQLDYWASINDFSGGLIADLSDGQQVFMVKDGNQIKSAIGNAGTFSGETDNILSQPDGGHGPVKRGYFSPSTNTIALLKNADLSTFLHESGHYFFETDIALAAEILRENAAFGADTMSEGKRQILRDVSSLLRWHGIEGDIASQIDQWSRMDFEERRAYHEKTAESFERYLMEGKAPSIELQSVFQTFRQWLISVYKSIKDFIKRNPDAGELSAEVRAVFDRMLATEEEIKLAEQARSMIPLFADAVNAGMTPSEFAEYQKLGNEATQAAIDELQAKGIRDMKWLTGARSRMLKKLQKQAKAQRAEMRAMARMDVLSEPVYQAWNLLTSKMTDEDKLAGKPKRSEAVDPAVDSLFEAIAKMGGLNREALAAQWGIDPKDKAESGLFGRPVMRAKDGGRSIDWMVEALTEEGYLTPDDNGKGDVLELEERFKAELRGDRQYSSIRNWEPEQLPGQGQDLSSITAARIDRASLDSMEGIPQEVIDRLESLGMTAKTGGIHPDVLSEILPGWTSGDELVRALASAVPLKQAIEARTDQWMLEQYADLATPEAIERAADMAIHNDARERFLLAEHKALVKASGDKTQRQIMLTAAKDYARQLIGRQRIRDIRPSQYTAAEARAAKAAAASKDIAQKATEKRNQILSGMAARESYRAQDDVAKGLHYLKKFDSPTIRKRVSGDYVDQIEALLEKIDLRKRSLKDIDRRKSFGAFVRSQIEKGVVPAMSDSLLPPGLRAAYQAKVMERDENGELIVRDDVEQAKVLADYLDMAEARSYKDMTVEEFRGLVETIRQIEHLGRKKKSLLTARDGKTYEQKRDELVASVTANAERLPDRLNRTVPNDRAEKLRGLRDFRISLRKIGMIMRLLDGNKDGGQMWDFFVRSANERGNWETEQIANASEVLTRALRPVFALKGGMRGKGIHFESIGRSLNREQRIGLALNVGNEGNLQRLLDGEGWTYADIQPVLESLTAAEWQAVQEVWDHMDSYRPLIAAIERRTVGGEPEWVQPMQFTVNTRDGQTLTLKGGYYPVKYDAEASQRAEELEDATDAKRAMNAATNTSTTHRSFVKKRSEAVVGRPLELSLSAMYSGVQDVIHDLAWREWLIDASKMISSSTLDDAIRRKYGAETPRAIRQWISDIAAGTRKPRGVFDRAAAFLRKNVAASGLALNFMNAVQNVTGLQNSIERIGAKWLAAGQGEYLSGPKDAAAWVHEKSSLMEHRARTQFRDLNELRNVVESGDNLLTKAKNNQFVLITMTQKMVDLPTWIGAYRKAEAEGAVVQLEDGSIDDSRAVAMADQAVIDAQGSGMIKDLSAVERGGELAKLFTAYYSYMNTTYNLAANRVSGARGGSPRERGAAALHLLVLMAVPVAIMAVLKAGLTPGDDDDFDDPEKLAKKLAMEQASFAMGLIPFAREFTPMIQPFLQDQTFGYQGPAGLRIIGDATKFTQQAAQGDFDDGFRKAAVGMSGSLFGLPAAQINRTWTGVEALADDKTDNPAALMFGYQEKK